MTKREPAPRAVMYLHTASGAQKDFGAATRQHVGGDHA